MIIDILFATGTVSFGYASLRQLRKVWRTHKTDGISLTHYKVKMFAITCMLIGYVLSGLLLSFIVSAVESSVTIALIYLITKYRKDEQKMIEAKDFMADYNNEMFWQQQRGR